MTRIRLILALAAVAATPAAALAAFGDGDVTYGLGGVAPAHVPNIAKPAPGPTYPVGLRVLSGGGVDVVAPTGNGARLVLSRLRYTSALARTGLVQAPFGVSAFQPFDSVPYGAGFVTIGQITTSVGNAIVVVRTTATGALDTTFGRRGVAKLPPVLFGGTSMRVAIAPGGYVVTSVGIMFPGKVSVAVRLNKLRPNGTLEPTFGNKGSVTIPVGDADLGGAAAVAVASDSKIVLGVSGYFATGAQHDAVLRRLSNGAPDTTFDTDGVSSRAPAAMAPFIADVALQPDNKITILATDFGGSGTPVMYRMKANGQLDGTFGAAGGHVNLQPSGSTSARADVLLRRSDGRYVATGSSQGGTTGGWIGRTDANAQSVTVTPTIAGFFPGALGAGTSKVVVAGTDNTRKVMVVSVADSDPTAGSATTTVDAAGGITEGSISSGLLFPDAHGGVFLATRFASTLRIVALNAKGQRNQTFGPSAGRGAISRGGLVGNGYATKVRRLRDGRIAVTTTEYPVGSHLALLRPDGSPDTSFQGGDLNLGASTAVGDVVQLADGRFLLGMGHFDAGLNAWVMRLVRLNLDGTYDTTFSGDGIVDLPYPAGRSQSTLPPGAIHVHAGPGGYIAVGASQVNTGGGDQAMVARVSTTGVPDPTIGGGSGVQSIGPVNLVVFAASVDGLGRTLIVGVNDTKAVVLRLAANLTLDPTFSGDGVMSLVPAVGSERFTHVTSLPDRSLVVQGLIIPTGGGFPTVDYVAVSATGSITGRRQMLSRTADAGAVVGPDGRLFTATELNAIVPDTSIRRLKGLVPSRPLKARRVIGRTFTVSVDSRGLTLTTLEMQARRAGRWVRIGRRNVPALVGRRTLALLTTRRSSDTTFRAVVVNASGRTLGVAFHG